MATLYITEYSSVAFSGPEPHGYQAPLEPGVDQTPLPISGSPVPSAVFANTTRLVRIHTDSICSIVFGVTPVAATDNRRLAANQTEYFGVPVGSGLKVSVIQNV